MRKQVSEFSAHQVLVASNNICCSSIQNDRKIVCANQKNPKSYENTSMEQKKSKYKKVSGNIKLACKSYAAYYAGTIHLQ